jgi:hypothetical protein
MDDAPIELSPDEFRLLAYLRGYTDGWGENCQLDQGWVGEQLSFSVDQLYRAPQYDWQIWGL